MSLLSVGLALLSAPSSTQAASLIYNGGFETWGTTTGTPPTGTPTSWWNNVPLTQTAGLVAGSTYSATLLNGNQAAQTLSSPTNNFTLNLSFVATYGESGLRMNLYELGTPNTIVMAFKTVQGASAGLLNLQTYDPTQGGWKTLVTGFNASTYDAVNGIWSPSYVYDFSLTADYAASTYSLTFGAHGGTQSTNTYNFFYSVPTARTFTQIYFTNTAGSYSAVDNIVINAVPEPATWALLACSLTTVMVLRRRKIS